jgi:hypothetical protein
MVIESAASVASKHTHTSEGLDFGIVQHPRSSRDPLLAPHLRGELNGQWETTHSLKTTYLSVNVCARV